MSFRGTRWPFLFSFLMVCSLWSLVHASAPSPTPLLPHKDQADEKEFQNVYQNMQKLPTINIGAGVPTYTPKKIGDIFVSTTTANVYIATGTVNSGSWMKL
jgi:hypothetical protein